MEVKFLIIRFSSIGDIILTTPVIRCLKNQVENAIVHYVTKESYYPLLEANPYIDKIHLLHNNNMKQLLNELKNEDFHYIIDLHKNFRSLRLKNYLNILSFDFNKLNFKKWLLVNFKINKLPNVHIVDRYLKSVEIFDVYNDYKGLDYFIPEHYQLKVEIPENIKNGYVVIVVGAKHNTKKIPPQKIIDLIEKLKYPTILIGGKEEVYEASYIIQNIKYPFVLNFCGKLTLHDSAIIIKDSKAVVTPDTGMMHIAAAFKKNIISLWGNTVPEFGMYPYMPGEKSKIFEVKNLKCRPCSKLGFKKCPHKHFKCMTDINTDEIVEYLKNII